MCVARPAQPASQYAPAAHFSRLRVDQAALDDSAADDDLSDLALVMASCLLTRQAPAQSFAARVYSFAARAHARLADAKHPTHTGPHDRTMSGTFVPRLRLAS